MWQYRYITVKVWCGYCKLQAPGFVFYVLQQRFHAVTATFGFACTYGLTNAAARQKRN